MVAGLTATAIGYELAIQHPPVYSQMLVLVVLGVVALTDSLPAHNKAPEPAAPPF
ncbi:hypothetical protein [Micromonospora craniellae]|uniref:hypothetical protein n=1 Tax=Micromonospora craniellae TaxID=2294034 RepID=UPI001CC53F86|nr:hypothetical protein [Micromonospora craniellae]